LYITCTNRIDPWEHLHMVSGMPVVLSTHNHINHMQKQSRPNSDDSNSGSLAILCCYHHFFPKKYRHLHCMYCSKVPLNWVCTSSACNKLFLCVSLLSVWTEKVLHSFEQESWTKQMMFLSLLIFVIKVHFSFYYSNDTLHVWACLMISYLKIIINNS
jgi:hypothetical protein